MHHFLLPAVVALLCAASASAEVLRCVDAAGKVSYTDGACPAGTRPERRVSTREPVTVLPDPAGATRPPPPPARESINPPATRQPPPAPVTPGGAAIIDGRGTSANERTDDSRWDTDRGSDPLVAQEDYGYPYPYAGVQRPARPPRDMRPRIRNCDATGCTDTQGNTYNRNTGQLDRYQGIDGKTCRPVGTTTVCR
jgi:hypothetical protein